MKSTRREFVKYSALAGAGTLFARRLAITQTLPPPYPQPVSGFRLQKFVDPMRQYNNGTIPLASRTEITYADVPTDYYEIDLVQGNQVMHSDFVTPGAQAYGIVGASFNGTKFWGYTNRGQTGAYLGAAIVASRRPVLIKFRNLLPPAQIIPYDTSLVDPTTGNIATANRAAIHLHGGFIPWVSDGGPFDWWEPAAQGHYGPSFLNNDVFGSVPGLPSAPQSGEALYYYPNTQRETFLWYHDHAYAITRTNAYAGLASGYLLYAEEEEYLTDRQLIPSLGRALQNGYSWPYEIPIVLQDKTFVDDVLLSGYQSFGGIGGAVPGDLYYDYQYTDATPPATPPVPSAVPEFFGQETVINGSCYPFLEVERRHYRFRFLNGSQARFFNLQLYYAQSDSDPVGSTEPDLLMARRPPSMLQIGTEGGFLPTPVVLNDPPKPFFAAFDVNGDYRPFSARYTLLLGPAERADVIIDFSNVPAGARLILYNDAPGPYPAGDLNFRSDDGKGPDTSTLMQFRVVARTGAADPASFDHLEYLARIGRPKVPGAILPPIPRLGKDASWDGQIHDKTLNEDEDEYGRLRQTIGTNQVYGGTGFAGYARPYLSDPTEIVQAGQTQIWRIFNLTADTHPIHFHLVNVQIVSRQPFDVSNYNGIPAFIGPSRACDPNERGWKETVRINPGECMTVIAKYDLPTLPHEIDERMQNSPRLRTAYQLEGHEYVWHCHILEHEEHDMMRPLVIIPPPNHL